MNKKCDETEATNNEVEAAGVGDTTAELVDSTASTGSGVVHHLDLPLWRVRQTHTLAHALSVFLRKDWTQIALVLNLSSQDGIARSAPRLFILLGHDDLVFHGRLDHVKLVFFWFVWVCRVWGEE